MAGREDGDSGGREQDYVYELGARRTACHLPEQGCGEKEKGQRRGKRGWRLRLGECGRALFGNVAVSLQELFLQVFN